MPSYRFYVKSAHRNIRYILTLNKGDKDFSLHKRIHRLGGNHHEIPLNINSSELKCHLKINK